MVQSPRQSVRIIYPPHLAPEMALDGATYRVVDLSAGGCLLSATMPARYRVGQQVHGTIRFKDGSSLRLDAYVLRSHDNTFALEFLHEIPQGYIERETAIFGSRDRDRRRFFRLRYSSVPNPTLLCAEQEQFRVMEISEAAIVLCCEDLERFMKGQRVQGTLVFHDGEGLGVDGYVFRMTARQVIVLLSRFLPTARIMKEQQYALQQIRKG
ncbi:MAG TPA: PilZ domain-containing protein [Armatimonadota bacterium]|nr:PilZ domain-containing protein [Armatimonadota bacterium]